ncbi:FAD:protein FMN transferase [Yinghuangia sp. ASG 101]|uniref:FAD:protein FMN transferase n=1 Tax=Yinghuangia sp. ASG 101 TaxID=2896848 RepID=UPI002F911875
MQVAVTLADGRVSGVAVATSGTAERGIHTIDPRTGEAVPGPVSATVTGPRLLWADVYAKAAAVLGREAEAWIAGVDGYELVSCVAGD